MEALRDHKNQLITLWVPTLRNFFSPLKNKVRKIYLLSQWGERDQQTENRSLEHGRAQDYESSS